jgi:hypothetical protein
MPGILSILLLLLLPGRRTQEEPEKHQHELLDPGGMYGEYESTREASGTSWQPGSSPMDGIHFERGGWNFMIHGFVTAVYRSEPAPRGDDAGFSTNMLMVNLMRPTLEGTFGVRTMISLEPTLGATGYPLLLQTGETADGVNPLYDRQHPHDLFMELALTYTLPIADQYSMFLYFAPVGEPALGPAVFMQRFSAYENPVAPIGHHWFDGTHITYGVLTLGASLADKVKLEGSLFRGREPDQYRWGVEAPGFDSCSFRATVNPNDDWSLQASFGKLEEPEVLHPAVDMRRFTASATYNRRVEGGNWQTTVLYGSNARQEDPIVPIPSHVHAPGSPQQHAHTTYRGTTVITSTDTQRAFLAESAVKLQRRHTFFGRFEWTEKDELFPTSDPRHLLIYGVSNLNGGYLFDLPLGGPLGVGLGASASVYLLDEGLEDVYETRRPASFMVYARFRLQ